MTLRFLATDDLNAITTMDFNMPIVVTNPAGMTKTVQGFTNDIARIIDPDTGQIVSGRLATVAISIRSLTAQGLGLPQGIEDMAIKPWVVMFSDVDANEYTFKVLASNPDRALGIVTCELEFYND